MLNKIKNLTETIINIPLIEIGELPECQNRLSLEKIYLCEFANRTVTYKECLKCPYKNKSSKIKENA